jgi:hypothetical protein
MFVWQMGFDDVTVLLCGSSQTHLGTEMPSGGGHIIKAAVRQSERNSFGKRGLLDLFGSG